MPRTFAALLALALGTALPAVAGNLVTAAGNGSTTASGDGGTAIAAGLARPVDVGIDAAGNLFVLDADGKTIRRVAPDNTIATVATLPAAGLGLAVANDGTLYVAMSTALRRIAPNGAIHVVRTHGRGTVAQFFEAAHCHHRS